MFVFACSSKWTTGKSCLSQWHWWGFFFICQQHKESRQKSIEAVFRKFLTNLNLLNVPSAAETATVAVSANFPMWLACLSWCCRQFPSHMTSLKQVAPWQNWTRTSNSTWKALESGVFSWFGKTVFTRSISATETLFF